MASTSHSPPHQGHPGHPLTSGPFGVSTHVVFLGGSRQLSLCSQRPGQGQQPCGPGTHQAGRARGERRRGRVGEWLELILLLKGERTAGGAVQGGQMGVNSG